MHWDAIAAELSWLQDILPSERNGHGEAFFSALPATAAAAAGAELPPPAAGALIGPGPAGVSSGAHAAASRFVCRSAFCHNDLLSGNFLVDAASPLFRKGDHVKDAAAESSSGSSADAARAGAGAGIGSAEPAAAAAAPPATAGLHKHHSTDGSGRDARAGSFSSDDGEGGAGAPAGSSAASSASASSAAAAVGPATKAVLIDYEYADTNYAAFDLANHLCEHAGFDCDWRGCFPPRSVRLDLMRLYADACSRHGSAAPASASSSSAGAAAGGAGVVAAGTSSYSGRAWSDEEVDVMLRWVDVFALASHFWWGLWALVQSKYSPIDFDFESYCGKRLEGYALHKAALYPDAPRVELLTPVHVPAATAAERAADSAPAGSA